MMEKNFRDSLKGICGVLHKHEVEYLVVGGAAVALYGYFRMSISSWGVPVDKPDLDFWYNPSYGNYYNLLNAIEELGVDVAAFKEEQTPDPRRSFFKLNLENFTIDFLPEVPGLDKFVNSYSLKEITDIDGIEIFFINFDDLIANKKAVARDNDIRDIDELNKIRGKEGR